MIKNWLIVAFMLVVAAGCNPKPDPEKQAEEAAQNAKVIEAIKNQKKGNLSMPLDGPADTETTSEGDDKAAAETGAEGADNANADATSEGDGSEAADDKKEGDGDAGAEDGDQSNAAFQQNADDVLNASIAAAKADDQAVLVYFMSEY